jgi:2-methylcitrate dehydratase PrpD
MPRKLCEETMAQEDTQEVQRRTFLKQMAAVAGSAPLASALAGSASAQSAATAAPTAGARNEEPNHETRRLAAYASKLRYEDLPPAVVQRAKDCIIDGVATVVYGAELPWSKMIIAHARRYGSGGKSFILGDGPAPVHAPAAALANGALAHAFELDSGSMPESGAHPAAVLLTAGLAVSQEQGYSGRDLITAFVAGAEVMFRIGHATKHTNEIRGFHAPGTTGPFGAAVSVGRLRSFDADKMTNALGIAGSCAGGLLEFVNSGDGAMVKRLHLGRGAESGVLAASLADQGFTGPSTVLEGEFGFLRVFCNDWDLAELTRGLGQTYFTMDIFLKHYACHGTAQNPIEAIQDLRAEHKFTAADVASIAIACNARVAKRNNIPAPAERMMAQYSVPFSVALSLFRDARDPRSFDDAAVHDAAILDLASRTSLNAVAGIDNRDQTATVTVRLKDGRELSRSVSVYKGMPERPLDRGELKEKFLLLTGSLDRNKMEGMFDRLQHLEAERSLDWLSV